MPKQSKLIRIYDSVVLEKPTGITVPEDSKEKVQFIDNFINNRKHLLTTVKATHAGRLTRNHGFYFPEKMRKGVKTLLDKQSGGTSPFPKPVLVNHNSDKDPIGRVVGADYIDLTGQISSTDKFHDALYTLSITDQLWKAVDVVETLLKAGLLTDSEFEGLGYIRSTGRITDPDAIVKILDQRYMTVSTSASSNKAICSVCKENWTDAVCEHSPGKIYDDVPCFLMAGDLTYDEWSFVSRPADSEAVTEGLQLVDVPSASSGSYTQIDVGTDSIKDVYSTELSITLKDSEGELPVTVNKDQLMNKLHEIFPSAKDELAKLAELPDLELEKKVDSLIKASLLVDEIITGKKSFTDQGVDGSSTYEVTMLVEMHNSLHFRYDYMSHEQIPTGAMTLHAKLMDMAESDGWADSIVKGKLDEYDADGKVYEDSQAGSTQVAVADSTPDVNQAVVLDFDKIDITSDKLTEEEAEYINDLLEKEAVSLFGDALLEDAKLSTASRKRLSGSTFCGPGRSFPVPDCCLTGDTKIKLLDGKDVPIKDLVDREDIWVYGFDHKTKSIVPAKVSKVWLAVENQDIYRITLDNGEYVDCTGNHPFLTKDGDYTRADKLKIGISLMPLYTVYSKNRDGLSMYEKVYQPWYNYWEYTHHMSARGFYKRALSKDEHIHHKNHLKKDNRPENLQFISKEDHLKEHFIPGSRDNKLWQIFDDLCTKRLASLKKITCKISRSHKTFDYENPDVKIPGTGVSLRDISKLLLAGIPRKRIAEKIAVSDRTLIDWLESARVNTSFSKIQDGPLYKEAMSLHFAEQFGATLTEIDEYIKSSNSWHDVQYRFNIDSDAIRHWFSKMDMNIPQGIKTNSKVMVSPNAPFNHKIVNIEIIGKDDAYDMEVPLTNNFALSAGVFVHNSHVIAARRLIGRYKGPGNKSSILSCVARKAKAMGCGSSSDSVVHGTVLDLLTEVFSLETKEVKELYDHVKKALERDGITLNDNTETQVKCKACIDRKESDEKIQSELTELRDQLKYLRRELKDSYEDYEQLSELLEKRSAENHELMAEVTALIKTHKTSEAYSDALNAQKAKTISTLSVEFTDLHNGINFDNMIVRLDGTSKAIVKPVEDPTLSRSDSVQESNLSGKIADKWTDKAVNRFKEIRDTEGESAALTYLKGIKRLKLIPTDFDISKHLNKD